MAAPTLFADDVRMGASVTSRRRFAVALAVIVLAGCTPGSVHKEAAPPAPARGTAAAPVTDTAVPLEGGNWRVEAVADGRVVVSRSPRGRGTTIEVRSASDPAHVIERIDDVHATAGSNCVSLAGAWLVRTDVTAVPSHLVPGPPQPWTLVATNLSTGRRLVLDRGMTDMARQLACPVAHGTGLAWTSGHARSTRIVDLAGGVTRRLLIPGDPIGWEGDRVLLAQYAGRTARVLRVGSGPTSRPELVLTATGVDQLRAAPGRLVWWGRKKPNSDNFHTRVYACPVDDCRTGNLPTHLLAALDVDLGWAAVSSQLVAWTSAGEHAPPLTITRLDDGSSVGNEVDSDAGPLVADRDTIAFVGTPLGEIAPMTLHVLQVSSSPA